MSRFLSPLLDRLTPYVPGEQPRDRRYVKLNTNESPFPPAPGVLEAVDRAALEGLNRYPDPAAAALEAALAARFGLRPAQALATNGSDEALAFCMRAFCDASRPPCFADVTYGFYAVLACAQRLEPVVRPLDERFRVRVEDYLDAPGPVFLANPNAPSGLFLPLSDVERIVRANPDLPVIVDEAYVDFGGQSAAGLIDRYANLLVVQTFSKSRNLAGVRIGFALGQEEILSDLRACKNAFNPYSLDSLALRIGEAAVRDEAYLRRCTEEIVRTREAFLQALRSRGFTGNDSAANFVFVRHPRLSGRAYYEALREKGVLVRYFEGPRTRDFVRITVGTPEDMRALLAATDAIEEENR